MKFPSTLPPTLSGDFWGGLAAMLVALPSAIAFGVTIYAAVGASFGAYGALAGILGATALGLIVPFLGGTNRLITAPCAPAAAVLSAFAIEQIAHGVSPQTVLVSLVVMGILAGLIQIGFGIARLGLLIKYMPYPVVSGYLSGVGLYIIAAQTPKLLGLPKGIHFWEALSMPASWQLQGLCVGVVTALIMILSPKVTKIVPAAILGLLSGVIVYFILGYFDPSLLTLEHNGLIIGSLGSSGGFIEATTARFGALSALNLADVFAILMPALTLAVLLSIDTLKTCVVLDAMTRSRHDSNKELIGQGTGNIISGCMGGIPGAGTMGATLVNIASGGQTRLSGWLEGILSLVAFVALGSVIAWVPVGALAAILIVIGVRMIDMHSFHFLKSRSTILDFVVIAAVVTTALTVSLIAASGVGILLAVVLFVKEQIGGAVVRRKLDGNEIFSKHIRVRDEMEILEREGGRYTIVELQGSLFFGTADKLYTTLENDLKTKDYIILDMARVQAIDITAAHIIEQIKAILSERGAKLLFSRIPKTLPTGKDMKQYFDHVGLVDEESVFDDFDVALEWVEEAILEQVGFNREEENKLYLREFDLFRGRKEETIEALEKELRSVCYAKGETIFLRGDHGDELFLIRKGYVDIVLTLEEQSIHISSFGQGNFFGEMAFLDGAVRSADAIAGDDTELYVLSRTLFNRFAEEHKKGALQLFEGLASVLAARLRIMNTQLGH